MMKILEDTLRFFMAETQNEGNFNASKFLNLMENAFQSAGFRDEYSDDEQKNILVIRLDSIGDNVLNTGFLRELRRNYPSAHITLIVNPTVYNLVELCPYVNEVLSFSLEENLLLWFNEAIKLCREKLWQRHFDICVNPRWGTDVYYATLLSFISGARERVAYSTKVYPGKDKFYPDYDLFLTNALLNPPNVMHETERDLFVLKAMGLTIQDTKNELWYSHEDVLNANKLILENGGEPTQNLIAICNFAGNKGFNRIYPTELLAQALKQIADKTDYNFVYLGSKMFEIFGNFLKQSLGNRLINLCGKTTLREMCAIISKTSMYIGGNTGTMHIAAALKKPVIMIYKDSADCPKNYISTIMMFSPWQTPTKIVQPEHSLEPCNKVECWAQHPHCITQIKPEEIVDAFDTMKNIMFKSK